MGMLLSLWLPIVLSTVAVFVASSIIWMALPIHKKDFLSAGEKEADVLSALKSAAFPAGAYWVPWCQGPDPKDPVLAEKMKNGPWAIVTVMAGPPKMGSMLGLWLFNLLLTSLFVGYVASAALPQGADYLKVFQVVGATAFLAYAGNSLTLSIWQGMPWSQLPGRLFDGVVYALLTAGIFGWLWPRPEVALPGL